MTMFKVSIHDAEQNFEAGQKVVNRKGKSGLVMGSFYDGKVLMITVDIDGQPRKFQSQFLRLAN